MNNPDTRVAISCFSGDQRQLDQSLDLYLHHECPVTILSPEDAQAYVVHGGVENWHAGYRARSGPTAHARQLEYYKLLLCTPENWFLIHESDSVCIDPQIPPYLYEDPNAFWCNNHEAPWFLSRDAMQRMLAVSSTVQPTTDWVDRYQIDLAHAARVPVKFFKHSVLGPISGPFDPVTGQVLIPFGAERFGAEGTPVPPELSQAYDDHFQAAINGARAGANMIHSVKNGNAAHAIAAEYKRVVEDGPARILPSPFSPAPPPQRRRRPQAFGIGPRA
jgi:hypothetical protein